MIRTSMSSAELHSLISQLQVDSEVKFEYEADIAKAVKDRTSNSWYDDEDATRTKLLPPNGRMPYVPVWDKNSEIKTPEGILITEFVTHTTPLGNLDFPKYPKREQVIQLFQYALVDTNMHISDLHKQIKSWKKKVNDMNKTHIHADGQNLFIYNGSQYVPANAKPHKEKKKLSPSQQLKRDKHNEHLKVLRAERKANVVHAGEAPPKGGGPAPPIVVREQTKSRR